jgi:DNA-binding NarL/FixJ family response regulator
MPATVLFVDKDVDRLHAFEQLARTEPCRIIGAHSSDEALKTLERRSVQVVLADEDLPDQRGSELLAKIANDYPHVVRVLVTASPSLEVLAFAINRAHVYGVLLRPYAEQDVRQLLRDAFEVQAAGAAVVKVITQGKAGPLANLNLAGAVTHAARQTLRAPAPVPVAEAVSTRPGPLSIAPEFGAVSAREAEVAELLARGKRVPQIASLLSISRHTVRNHLKALYRKLAVHSQSELVEYVRRGRPDSLLPVVEAPRRRAIPESLRRYDGSVRILLVDSEPAVLRALTRALIGHELVTTSDGREAVELYRARPFEIVVCDVALNGFGGMDVYHALEKLGPEHARRVVLMAGGNLSEEQRNFLGSVNNARLSKPFDVLQLKATVDSHVAEHRRAELARAV